MQKFLSRLSVFILVLFGLSVFGWLVKHQAQGDPLLGDKVGKGLNAFVGFLDLFEKSVEEVQKLPETFVPTPADFEAVNKLEQDLFSLISYSNENKGRSVEIRNLKNDESLHRWDIPNPFQAHDRIMDPLLLPGKKLVYSYNGVTGLFCLDSAGNELWKQDTIAHHHGLNLDSAGNIWACSYTKENGGFIIYKGFYDLDGRELVYIDNTLSLLNAENGRILFHKSISEILVENGLENLLVKSANIEDPIHLNDVQPALKTTEWYKEGDVFMSFRNCSAIMHYRPATNKVIRLIEGLFYSQHDIDFLNDSTIIFFNNNSHTHWSGRPGNWRVADTRIDAGDFYSNTMAYDLKRDSLYYYEKEAYMENNIHTFTEGMQEVLADGSLWIEEQNSGRLWVIKDGEVIYKNVFPSHHEGHHHLPNWTRILTSQP
ncbi:MAG: arylsulfotransferase family protein [Bacteroidetes bacterium]|nr:arylsulfotransferase family protein [Bacteroidota bacterium]